MTLEQLLGKYLRLREELREAQANVSSPERHIDRLAEEMSALQRAMAGEQPVDEQTSDLLPGV